MSEIPSKYQTAKYEKVKKYIPFILLFLLTIVLMIFFRYNKQSISNLIEKGKRNLLSIYADNLRPLFTDTKFSEEELFNFALYQSLPIDREKNKVLILSNENGQPVYQISRAPVTRETNNYETFTRYLGMTKAEKERSDSILNSYRKQIYSSILISDENAYAVNPKIADLQKALLADLVSCAQKVDLKKTQKLFPAHYTFTNQNLSSIINAAKENFSNNYLLITPDTITSAGLTFDEKKWEDQLSAFEQGEKYASEITKMNHFKWDFEYDNKSPSIQNPHIPVVNYKIDSNISKVMLSGEALSKMINDTLRIKLEEVANKLKTISIPTYPKFKKGTGGAPKTGFMPPIPDPAEIVRAVNVGEITSRALKLVGDLDIPKLIEESLWQDTAFQAAMKDSIKSKKYQEKLKELNRKLKRMKLNFESQNK